MPATPPLDSLRQREALALAQAAHDDFPGMQILVHVLFDVAPLTDDAYVAGYALVIMGPGRRPPAWEIRTCAGYGAVYEAIHRYYSPVGGEKDAEEGRRILDFPASTQ